MANTSLPNLTERTATANTDLIHVNSGGTDYKETKANFLSDVNSSITSLNNSLANTLTAHQFAVSGGTHTMSGLMVGDLVFFVRNALGMYVITFLGRADAIITPVGLENVSMDNGAMTFTRTSPYSGEIVVLSRSRNVTLS